MSSARIIFAGTPAFSVASLAALVEAGHQVEPEWLLEPNQQQELEQRREQLSDVPEDELQRVLDDDQLRLWRRCFLVAD